MNKFIEAVRQPYIELRDMKKDQIKKEIQNLLLLSKPDILDTKVQGGISYIDRNIGLSMYREIDENFVKIRLVFGVRDTFIRESFGFKAPIGNMGSGSFGSPSQKLMDFEPEEFSIVKDYLGELDFDIFDFRDGWKHTSGRYRNSVILETKVEIN